MKKNKVVFLLIIFVISMFFVFFSLNNKDLNEISLDKEFIKKIEKYQKISEISKSKGKLKNIFLFNFENKKHYLDDKLENKNKFIFIFSNKQCSYCIDHILELIKFNKNTIGSENILLLGKFDNQVDFSKFKIINKIDVPFFNIFEKDFELSVDSINYPYIIITNKTLSPKEIFIPIKEYPLLGQSFIDNMKKKYNTSLIK